MSVTQLLSLLAAVGSPLNCVRRRGHATGLVKNSLDALVSTIHRAARPLAVAAGIGASVAGMPNRVEAQCMETPGAVQSSITYSGFNDAFGLVYDWMSIPPRFVVTRQTLNTLYNVDPNTGATSQWMGPTLENQGRGAACGDGFLWFANAFNRVEKWTDDGNKISAFDTGAVSLFGITYDPISNSLLLYDADPLGHKIMQYQMNGVWRATIDSPPEVQDGQGIAFRPYDRHLFVTTSNTHISELQLSYLPDGTLSGVQVALENPVNVQYTGLRGIDYRPDINQLVSIRQGSIGQRKIYTLDDGVCQPGDANGDGVVDAADATDFTNNLLSGIYSPECDMNYDGSVDGQDIQPFVNKLLNP